MIYRYSVAELEPNRKVPVSRRGVSSTASSQTETSCTSQPHLHWRSYKHILSACCPQLSFLPDLNSSELLWCYVHELTELFCWCYINQVTTQGCLPQMKHWVAKTIFKTAHSVWVRCSSFSKLGGREGTVGGGWGGRSLLAFLWNYIFQLENPSGSFWHSGRPMQLRAVGYSKG